MIAAGSAQPRRRPFPGLRPFAEDDSNYFFGRTDQIFALYRMVDRSRFVAVVGSSGSGKSSLVFAGLLPLLKKETAQAGGRDWVSRSMTPGGAPLDRLIEVLAQAAHELDAGSAAGDGIDSSRRDRIAYLVRRSSRGLVQALGEIDGLRDKTFVLVVDQFEELFRFAATSQADKRDGEFRWREESGLFVKLLLDASRVPNCNLRIILTMRSDFIGDCALFHGLPEAVSETQFLVPSLAHDQLEEVICGPVKEAAGTIDPMLVERLLNDAVEGADQLPILQHCMMRLWDRAGPPAGPDGAEPGEIVPEPAAPAGDGADKRHLALAHYESVGRMSGALSQHANRILESLPGLERVVEKVFRALSEIDKEGRATRRAISLAKLRAETGADEGDLVKVLDRLRDDDCSFLRPPLSAMPKLRADTQIDVGHEALLRRWEKVSGRTDVSADPNDPRRSGWMQVEARAGRRYQGLLAMVAGDAADSDRLEPRGTWAWWTALRPTEAWAERYGGDFNRVDRFLKESFARARRNYWIKWTSVAAGAVLVIALGSVAGETLRKNAMAQQSFELTVGTAQAFAGRLLASLNHGTISAKGATELLETAEGIIKRVQTIEDTNATRALRAHWLLTASDILLTSGDAGKALEKAKQARDLANDLLASDSGNRFWQTLRYESAYKIADAAAGDHRNEAALEEYRVAQDIAHKMSEQVPDRGEWQYRVAFIDSKIGETLRVMGRFGDALKEFDGALKTAKALAASAPDEMSWQALVPSILAKIGATLAAKKDFAGALSTYDSALAIQTELMKRPNADDVVRSNLATTHRDRGAVLVALNRLDEAIAEYTAAIKLREALVEGDPGNALWLTYLVPDYGRLSELLQQTGKLTEALKLLQKEVAARQKLANKDSTNESLKREVERATKRHDDLMARAQLSKDATGSIERAD